MAQQSLQNYIDTLKNEGILDGEYEETRKVQFGANLPHLMMDLINSYLHDGDNSMKEIADLLTERNVDFTKVTTAAHLIKGGGKSCKTSHEWVVNEFYCFRDKLGTLYQMERAIVNKESTRRG